jgi:dienelactone hydrolase
MRPTTRLRNRSAWYHVRALGRLAMLGIGAAVLASTHPSVTATMLSPAAAPMAAEPAKPMAAAPSALAQAIAPGVFASFTSGGGEVPIERFDPPAAAGAGTGRRPAILVLHGAGARAGTGWSDPYRGYSRLFAKAGFVVFFPHYFERRGAPAAPPVLGQDDYAQSLAVILDAVAYAARQPGAEPSKIGLSGFSLGAALALTAASREPHITAVAEAAGWFVGDPAELQKMPPVLILHGEADPVIAVGEARKIEKILQAAHRTYEIRLYPGQGHRFVADAALDCERRTIAFFQRYLA